MVLLFFFFFCGGCFFFPLIKAQIVFSVTFLCFGPANLTSFVIVASEKLQTVIFIMSPSRVQVK